MEFRPGATSATRPGSTPVTGIVVAYQGVTGQRELSAYGCMAVNRGTQKPGDDDMKRTTFAVLAALVIVTAAATACSTQASNGTESAVGATIQFHDARQQATEFIAYYNAIQLTEDQERIKEAALTQIPAPCCNDYTIATCCCPCNLAKSAWGLANHLIAERGMGAPAVKEVVADWLTFANDGNLEHDACYKNRCNQPMKDAACGGMDERRVL